MGLEAGSQGIEFPQIDHTAVAKLSETIGNMRNWLIPHLARSLPAQVVIPRSQQYMYFLLSKFDIPVRRKDNMLQLAVVDDLNSGKPQMWETAAVLTKYVQGHRVTNFVITGTVDDAYLSYWGDLYAITENLQMPTMQPRLRLPSLNIYSLAQDPAIRTAEEGIPRLDQPTIVVGTRDLRLGNYVASVKAHNPLSLKQGEIPRDEFQNFTRLAGLVRI